MRLFPSGIEHADIMPVQRPHDTDPGEHRRPATRDEHQVLHRICHSGAVCSAFGSLVMLLTVSSRATKPGRSIGSPKGASSLPPSDARSGDRAGASTSGLFLSRQSIRNPAV
jgi:hypothetical protein